MAEPLSDDELTRLAEKLEGFGWVRWVTTGPVWDHNPTPTDLYLRMLPPDTARALVAEVRRLRQENERLRSLLRECVEWLEGDDPLCGAEVGPHVDGCPWPEVVAEARRGERSEGET